MTVQFVSETFSQRNREFSRFPAFLGRAAEADGLRLAQSTRARWRD